MVHVRLQNGRKQSRRVRQVVAAPGSRQEEQDPRPRHYDRGMELPAEAPPALRERSEIPDAFKWNLRNIFASWDDWKAAYAQLDRKIAEFESLRGTLSQGADRLLSALALRDQIGQLEYKVWYFASLWYDQDRR